jgi:hypothetical protein
MISGMELTENEEGDRELTQTMIVLDARPIVQRRFN